MRISSPPPLRRLMACAGVLLCLALGGCVPAQEGKPEVRRTPTSAPAASAERPVFASDEEALAAAEASLRRYIDVSNSIAHSGGDGLDRLQEVAIGALLQDDLNIYGEVKTDGTRIIGVTTFDQLSLLPATAPGERSSITGDMFVVLCMDVSDTTVLSTDGTNVTPSGRVGRFPLQMAFTMVEFELLPSDAQIWPGDHSC